MSRKNILVVHNVADLKSARRSTLDYIYAFERYAPDNNYHYHRMFLPVPACVQRMKWDAVVFDSTALGVVTIRPRERIRRILEQWRFIRGNDAVKLVFPQDDASHCGSLDLFFNWLGADAVFSVRPDCKDLIYPITSRRADFISTFSGFIDDLSIKELESLGRSFDQRQWDVGQRVTMYPAWGGRFSRLKGVAAIKIKEECQQRGLAQNISVGSNDVFLGDDWFRFLGDCRFVVGAEGGHSIWDPYGVIQDSVNAYVAEHPGAPFEEIEDACFLGLDGFHEFPGIGPRIFEAAIMGCGQILVEGQYRDLLEPWRHYIPLRTDFSNLGEVFSAMESRSRVGEMIAAVSNDIVRSPRFRFSTMVSDVFRYIESRHPECSQALSYDEFKHRLEPYEAELVSATLETFKKVEGLSGVALGQWVRALLAGQFADTGTLDRLLDRNPEVSIAWMERKLADVGAELSEARQQLTASGAALKDAEQRLVSTEGELEKLRRELADREARVASAESELEKLRRELADREARVASAESELVSARQQIDAAREKLEAANEAVRASVDLRALSPGLGKLVRTSVEFLQRTKAR